MKMKSGKGMGGGKGATVPMKNPGKPKTPASAIGRSGDAKIKQIPSEVVRTKVPRSSLHRGMPD